MKKLLGACFGVLLVTGCASTEGYKEYLSRWTNKESIELIRAWGPPQQVYEEGGSKFLVYQKHEAVYMPGQAPSYTTTVIAGRAYTQSVGGSDGQTYEFACTTTFETIEGKIVNWMFRGNNCVR